jgi:hypothetical protein
MRFVLLHCLRRRQLAPFALMLIVWVVVLCATKNMGLTFACPYAQVSEHSVEWQAAQPAPTDTEKPVLLAFSPVSCCNIISIT